MTRFGELLAQRAASDPVARRQPLVGAARARRCRLRGAISLPVATTFRRAHLFDPLHPSYAGDLGIGPNPKLLARVKEADLIVLIGGRLGEMPSQGYTLLDIPGPRQTFVHVHPGVEELGRVYRPHLAINASADGLCARARPAWRAQRHRAGATAAATAHAEFLAWTDKPTAGAGRRSISARSSSGCARCFRPTR